MTPFALLQSLAAAAETGMLFVRTEEGHQARIALATGQIVHVSYALRRGREALARMSETQSVSSSFTRGLVAERHDDLPPQELLLQVLGAVLAGGTATMPSPGPTTVQARPEPVPAPPKPSPDAGGARTRGGDEARRAAGLEQLRRLMIDYVGPIGGLLVEQEASAGFRTWAELVERLSREVSPEAEAQAFRQAALRVLR